MKKILLGSLIFLFASANAFAGVNIGISGAFTMLDTTGTETTKSSSEKNNGSKDETVIVPSLFIEMQAENGVTHSKQLYESLEKLTRCPESRSL